MKEKSNIGVLVLAGGLSERMNYPKPWLQFNKKHTFLERIIEQYSAFGVNQQVVVLNEKFGGSQWTQQLSVIDNHARVILNDKPEKGKSYSIYLGLEHIRDCSYVFIQNIDNPFIDENLLSVLKQNSNYKGYTVPVYEGKRGHPILISKKIMDELRHARYESFNLREFLKNYPKTEVATLNKKILANINTEEDYQAFFNSEVQVSLA